MNDTKKMTTAQKIEEAKKVANELKVVAHYYDIILNLEEVDLISFLNRQIEPFEILDKKWQKQTKETICNNVFLQEMAKDIDYPDSSIGRKVGGIEAVTELVLEKVVEKIRDELDGLGMIS